MREGREAKRGNGRAEPYELHVSAIAGSVETKGREGMAYDTIQTNTQTNKQTMSVVSPPFLSCPTRSLSHVLFQVLNSSLLKLPFALGSRIHENLFGIAKKICYFVIRSKIYTFLTKNQVKVLIFLLIKSGFFKCVSTFLISDNFVHKQYLFIY